MFFTLEAAQHAEMWPAGADLLFFENIKIKIYFHRMEGILRKIKQELATVAFEVHPNVIYRITHSNPEKKAELKGLLTQGDLEVPHTVVEIDFVKRVKKLSRRQKIALKNQRTLQQNVAAEACRADPEGAVGNVTQSPETVDNSPEITIYNSSIFIYGQYIKYSRNMTQSPLIIKGQLKTVRCVSDFVSEFQSFFCSGPVKFMACGREDIDVRCIGGRPFVLEIPRPRKHLHKTDMDISLDADVDIINTSIVSKSCKGAINTDESNKSYEIAMFSPAKIHFHDVYELKQKTPLRVLHRRANITRHKTITVLSVSERVKEDGFYYGVDIKASSGTYIKEWVNGDFDRTLPNLNADLLALDVVSIEKSLDQSLIISEFRLNKRFVNRGTEKTTPAEDIA